MQQMAKLCMLEKEGSPFSQHKKDEEHIQRRAINIIEGLRISLGERG